MEDHQTQPERPEQGADPGTGILYVFGRQVKLLRTRAGLERPEFGSLTGYAPSTIASYEQGRRIPPPQFIDKADEVLDAGGVLRASKEEVARDQYPAFSATRPGWRPKRLNCTCTQRRSCQDCCRPRSTRERSSPCGVRCWTTRPSTSGSAWFKSSHSSGEGGECVEVAAYPHTVHIRDSKDKSETILSVDPDGWVAFVDFAARA